MPPLCSNQQWDVASLLDGLSLGELPHLIKIRFGYNVHRRSRVEEPRLTTQGVGHSLLKSFGLLVSINFMDGVASSFSDGRGRVGLRQSSIS